MRGILELMSVECYGTQIQYLKAPGGLAAAHSTNSL